LLLALTVAACGPGDLSQPPAAAGPGAGSPAGGGPQGELRKRFEGHWWVLSLELPVQGLSLNLEPTADANRWEGSWVSFDWRGSSDQQQLARVSRPVEVSARREGELMIIVGAVPQVDARGRPTGRRGDWELRVTRSSLPGQPLHYTGHMLHSDSAQDEPLAVELMPNFRAWSL